MSVTKIYIIDDEPAVLASLKRFFMDDDYKVTTFTDGREALAALAENEVAVIVTDQIMPGISGIEVLQRAREIAPDTIRVMITGALNLELALTAISRGEVYRIIAKPWGELELKLTIAQCVERHQLIQENHRLQARLLDQARIEMVKALVVTLNHKINNSLVFLSLGIDRLARSFAKNRIPEDNIEYMTKMRASCDEIAGLVKQLQNIEEIKLTEYLSGTGTMMIDTEKSR